MLFLYAGSFLVGKPNSIKQTFLAWVHVHICIINPETPIIGDGNFSLQDTVQYLHLSACLMPRNATLLRACIPSHYFLTYVQLDTALLCACLPTSSEPIAFVLVHLGINVDRPMATIAWSSGVPWHRSLLDPVHVRASLTGGQMFARRDRASDLEGKQRSNDFTTDF